MTVENSKTTRTRQPNPIKIVGYHEGYSGFIHLHPFNFDQKDARKLLEWSQRLVKFLDQKYGEKQ